MKTTSCTMTLFSEMVRHRKSVLLKSTDDLNGGTVVSDNAVNLACSNQPTRIEHARWVG